MRFCLTLILLLSSLLPAQAKLGDGVKNSNGPLTGLSVLAQIGVGGGIPMTNAQYAYRLGSHVYSTKASPSLFITIPIEFSTQYQIGHRFRVGGGVKRFGIKLKGDPDDNQIPFTINGSATIPFVRADILLTSSPKGAIGVSFQAGKALIGGSILENPRNGFYIGLPFFTQVTLSQRTSFNFALCSDYTSFEHQSWFDSREQARTSVLGFSLGAGLLFTL